MENTCRVSILGVQNAATQRLCRIFRTGNPWVILRLFDGKGHREVCRAKEFVAPPCTVLFKNKANFLGTTFSGRSFHHQNIVDGTMRSFTRTCIS